jgi:TusA-related sulfurtransferase
MSDHPKPNRVCNFAGVTCPYNYVKTKLALEEMDIDDIVEVIVDEGEPADNVPRSVKEDGQAILQINPNNQGQVHILIQKMVDYD